MKLGDRERHLKYRGTTIKIISHFSSESTQAGREENEIFRVERKNHQPKILYPGKSCFKVKEIKKTFSEKQKLREFITCKPFLEEMFFGQKENYNRPENSDLHKGKMKAK